MVYYVNELKMCPITFISSKFRLSKLSYQLILSKNLININYMMQYKKNCASLQIINIFINNTDPVFFYLSLIIINL